MGRIVSTLAILGACGRVGFAPAPDVGVGVDAGVDAAPQLVGFGAAHPLANVSSSSREFGVSISRDELELYFVSNRGGPYLMYRATRAAKSDDFGAPVPAMFGAGMLDAEPGLARGGLEMYLTTSSDVRHAVRPAPDQPWAATTSVDELATFGGVDLGASDQRLVVFGTTDNQLYESTRVAGVPQPPVLLGELLGYRANQNYPCMTDDGLEILFQAYDATGAGTILHAIRPDLDQPFGVAASAVDVAATVSVGDPAISADGHTLYYSSTETEPNGDLWIATRP